MARYTGSVCSLCRREGMKLYLKGDRCYTGKCAIEKRNFPPGMHGGASFRGKPSEFGVQLREKQKVKRIYGMLERQFRRFFSEAKRRKGITGENMMILLEKRLDNMVYRMGFARSRNEARQLVRHNHVLVNGHKANIPSMLLKVDDEVSIRDKSKNNVSIIDSLESSLRKGKISWVEVDASKLKGVVLAEPRREELTLPIKEQLIVELYSR